MFFHFKWPVHKMSVDLEWKRPLLKLDTNWRQNFEIEPVYVFSPT